MKKFEYNEHGACMNPNIYIKEGSYQQKYLVEVTTAIGDYGWVYGCSYETPNPGGGTPIWKGSKDAYKTEEEAGRAGLQKLRRRFEYIAEQEWLEATAIETARKALAFIDEALKPKVTQLTLFNET